MDLENVWNELPSPCGNNQNSHHDRRGCGLPQSQAANVEVLGYGQKGHRAFESSWAAGMASGQAARNLVPLIGVRDAQGSAAS